MNDYLDEIFEFISDQDKAQDVMNFIMTHPEKDPEIIILACMTMIHGLCGLRDNPRKEIEKVCEELLAITPE